MFKPDLSALRRTCCGDASGTGNHEERRIQSAAKMGLGRRSKHMLLLLKNHLEKTKVNVTAQSPDLNPTENLWSELKTDIRARRPSNLEELERFLKKRMDWNPSGDVWETCWKQHCPQLYMWQEQETSQVKAQRVKLLTFRAYRN